MGNPVRRSLLCVQPVLHSGHDLADVAKVPVHRREANVGDLVEPLELFHDQRAHFLGAHLLLGPFLHRRFDAIGNRFDRRHADGTLLAGLEQPGDEFLALEPLAGAVLLDHHIRDLVDPLVAGEAAAAVETFATPADDLPFLALPRVDNLVAEMAAERALHGWAGISFSGRACVSSLTRPMLRPSWAMKITPVRTTGMYEIACVTIAAATAASSAAPKNAVTPIR